jgi:sterol desaturase/sphingolipid hydroxylase (fatty acid hydroxylase superfamily)
MTWLDTLVDAFDHAHQWVYEYLAQPLLFSLGQSAFLEDAFVATQWLLLSLLQLAFMLVVFGALEKWRPAERVTDRPAIRVDVLYTLIHRLGLFRVGMFLGVGPFMDDLLGWAAVHGVSTVHLDQWAAPWWPGVTDTLAFSLLLYLLVFDFVDYWIHRGQHGLNRWWALHAVHHSQQQMTLWSDNRNHLLDDMVRDLIIVLVSRLIGVPPEQFLALVVLTQLTESLSHANTRVRLWPWLERCVVTPRFHRVHHGIGVGHESRGPGSLGGCNFAVLFPVWDILFGTADFRTPIGPTGIRDQLPDQGGRDYGRGFWVQQWLGLKRLLTWG